MFSVAVADSSAATAEQPVLSVKQPKNYRDVVLVTGGSGFIGSRFIKRLLSGKEPPLVINVDAHTYAAAKGSRFYRVYKLSGDEARFSFGSTEYTPHENPDHKLIQTNIGSAAGRPLIILVEQFKPNLFVHFAACSHVDRSIDGDLEEFVTTNVQGTMNVLDAALHSRKLVVKENPSRRFNFVYVSTDEVYGPVGLRNSFNEHQVLDPQNPYSATKAAAEHLVRAYGNTFDWRVYNITRGCNTFGEHQFPEKFLPVIISNALRDQEIPIYGDGQQSREWLHVDDHVSAICDVLYRGGAGTTYNVGSGWTLTNLQLATKVCEILGKPTSLITHVQDRPGHDRHYRIDSSRSKKYLGWRPVRTTWAELENVIQWYASQEGQDWVEFTQHDTAQRLGTL